MTAYVRRLCNLVFAAAVLLTALGADHEQIELALLSLGSAGCLLGAWRGEP